MANNQEEREPTQATEAEAQESQELTAEELENVVGGSDPFTAPEPIYNPNDAMTVDSVPTEGLPPLD